MIGLILIATGGERYTQFVRPLISSAEKFFPEHEVVLFTDEVSFNYGADVHVEIPSLGWPRATLMRYHQMLGHRDVLDKYSHLFYCDIDMLFVSKIEPEEILADGITAVTHPGFPQSFERNLKSTACVPESSGSLPYYQGCLVGGETNAFFAMLETITRNIDTDDKNGVMAIWHDESHLNRYLIDNPPAEVLSPAYAFPEPHYLAHPETWLPCPIDQFVPKIKHLEKMNQGAWKNGR